MNKTLRNLALVALVAAPFSAFADLKGEGTADKPYEIGTKEDLCEAYKWCKLDKVTYFIQTDDIDMTGVTDYIPFVGGENGNYTKPIVYDGRNHVIKNFAPTKDEFVPGGPYCYGQTIFGVLSGELKNLGIVDADINSAIGRMGIVAGYIGYSMNVDMPGRIDVEKRVTKVSNVYVTGKVTLKNGGAKYAGGMFGTTNGVGVVVENCFANVAVNCEGTGSTGGMFGTIGCPTTVENCYVAGTVAGTANLFIGTSGNQTCENVVLFNTGSDKVASGDVAGITMANTSATQAAGIAAVQAWPAFSDTENVDGFPALNYVLAGEGTEANPYIIDSAEALCNAWRKVDTTIPNTPMIYFVQTADIDMDGVDTYYAISGHTGGTADMEYFAKISYDGQNHVIKNFAPADRSALENHGYYCTSIFGVPSGEIKNLGVIGALVDTEQGVGILGAYGGHSAATGLTLENVFVEGEISSAKGYVGGMFGTTGNEVTMTNCFANVVVKGGATNCTAGLIGRLRNKTTVRNVYVAGSVGAKDGNPNVALVASTDKSPEFNATNVIAFNTGSTTVLASAITGGSTIPVATAETKATLIDDVINWRGGAFSETKVLAGYPILEAFEAYGEDAGQSGIFDAAVEEGSDAPAVYYNLQGVQVNNPENGIYIVRRGNKVTKEVIR